MSKHVKFKFQILRIQLNPFNPTPAYPGYCFIHSLLHDRVHQHSTLRTHATFLNDIKVFLTFQAQFTCVLMLFLKLCFLLLDLFYSLHSLIVPDKDKISSYVLQKVVYMDITKSL